MEEFHLVKTFRKATSTSGETDTKNPSCPFGLGVNKKSRSSPHLSTNGVSSFSGKTRPSAVQGAVEVLTCLTQELHDSGKADSDLWKNCETRWLQLFKLVEKQCEDQIVAQQEQFHKQIQCIQEEIRSVVRLQISNASWASRNSSSGKPGSSGSQMGFFSENSERNESVVSYPEPREPEMQQEVSTSQPDCNVEGSSVSSGYGTCCVSELQARRPPDAAAPMEPPGGAAEGPRPDSPAGGARSRSFYAQTPGDFCDSLKEDISTCPAEFEHNFLSEKISEVYGGKANSKSLTSWTRKLKQNHPKRVHTEEGRPGPGPGGAGSQRPAERPDSAAASHPRAFYLCQPDASPGSWMSDSGTGLTYWKLEEKDMYHPLPEALERTFVPPCAMEDRPLGQSNTSKEMKLPSLKDIYHKKQRGSKQLPARNLTSASAPSHPPEVLTLDPALHVKPSQSAGSQPHGFASALDHRLSSPDSVLEASVSAHSDSDSFSQASNVAARLSRFQECPAHAEACPADSWKSHAFQSGSRTTSTLPSVCTLTSNPISVNTVDEENTGTVASASASQSPLPGAASGVPGCLVLTSLDNPVVLSEIRQSLKERHARHVADLRAYYESEINSLKQRLEAKENSAVEEWKKTNQVLVDRCGQLDNALNEATTRVRTLEKKNNLLEIEVKELRERFSAASSASKVLQERIEEMRTSSKEKDNTIIRLKSRLQDLEESFENAYKLSDDKEARLKQENRMFQDLLGEYESLGREHGQVKDALNITENKLLDAHAQISDLKRMISKLEAQVKQVEHENMLNLRHHSDSLTRPARANSLATSDVSRRKWLIPGAQYSIFTGQPLGGAADRPLEETCVSGCRSPPEKDSSPGSSPMKLLTKKQREASDTPVTRALKELSEERVLKNWGTQTEKEDAPKSAAPRPPEPSARASPSPERRAQQRHPRPSPAAQRSSSLPPSSRKCGVPAKREIMLTPVTVAYSPKRSPKENLSPGFSHLLSKHDSSPIRSAVLLDAWDAVPVSTLQPAHPRKRLQFLPLESAEDKSLSEHSLGSHVNRGPCSAPSPHEGKRAPVRPAWEEEKSVSCEQCEPASVAPQGNGFEYTAKIRTLAETERFFDELTKEKDQIEAALSRMPSPGGRATLQTRLSQEALEDRLERINQELGSVRMTLKKFHVLRTSANL